MTVAITLLLGAVIVAVAAPRLLLAMADRAVDPVVVIVGWVLAVAGVLGTAIAGLIVMAVPGRFADAGLAHLVRRPWWAAVHNAPDLLVYHLAGWAAYTLLAAAVARLLWIGVREGLRRRSRVRDQLAVLRMVGATVPGPDRGPSTLWLRSDRPVAFSVGGRPGTVVLTDGLRRQLPPSELEAVLAHERAHLRGRHHLLVATADALARAFPFVRLFGQAPVALREQVELVADLSAVRTCGADAVRRALMIVTGAGTPKSALAMARDAVDVRLRYLAGVAEPPSRLGRIATCGALGGALAATPLLTASGLLAALSVLATAATALH
ncbi:M56 family metallopeptidase [Pseudonocardia acidicola]|uniref:M56 family metallopeptidase n=1 Tax=Pseudonocardia acidicola TaxID=2724939 RepID=A0ABX1SN00_9PSEU|nr:M56 family metallopeptidase [Pseudonocardia acidicola]NMI01519.1 M56 family metallopeptidase [Pseudonocardia acidicola]